LIIDPGIGDEDVDAAEGRERLLHHRIDRAHIRHIGLDEQRASALGLDRRGDLPARDRVHFGNDDGTALRGIAHRSGLADAATGAGDDRNLVLQAVCHDVTNPRWCRRA
jgi:hypothetical protein